MKIILLLHIYQPPYQSIAILFQVIKECYSKIFKIINKSSKGKILLNINASLTELLKQHRVDYVLNQIREAASNGRIEFTASGAYHPILPLLPSTEIVRQININNSINRIILGEHYSPIAFFSPEMCIGDNLLSIVSKMGFEWLLADEIAYSGRLGEYPKDRVFSCEQIKLLFRNRQISNALASSIWRNEDISDIAQFKKILIQQYDVHNTIFIALDGEVFGHHKKKHEILLYNLMNDDEIEMQSLSDLNKNRIECIVPKASSWSSHEFELINNLPYSIWKDPKNELQILQWKFITYLFDLLTQHPLDNIFRKNLDKALACDQFFWSSCKPWWGMDMVVRGAKSMLETTKSLSGVTEHELVHAQTLYEQIVNMAERFNSTGISLSKRRNYLIQAGLDETQIKKILREKVLQ